MPEEEPSVALDRSADREHSLARSFDDEAILREITSAVGPSLLEDTVDAVHELVSTRQKNEYTDITDSIGIVAPTEDSTELLSEHVLVEDMFHLVLSELNFVNLVEAILQSLINSVDAEAGSVLELDADNNQFLFRSSIGGGDRNQLAAFRVPMGQGIVGHVGESLQPLLIQDLEDNTMQLKSVSLATGLAPKTCLAVPLVIASQLYGVVELFNKKDGSYFNQQDLKKLEYGAKYAAKVLEVRFFTAELYQRSVGPKK